MADGRRHVVAAADRQVVAAVAADHMAARQAGIEPELVAEHGLGLTDRLATDFADLIGNRFEHRIGPFAQIVGG